MLKTKKVKILLLFGLVLLSVFSYRYISLELSKPKIYTKPIVDPIYTLDPSKTRFRTDYMTVRAIQGQLLSLGPFGQVKPGLIEKWDVNKEGTQYVLHLKKGVRFHSGRVATAKDVIFTLHYLAHKDSLINQLFLDIDGFAAYASGEVSSLKGIQLVDASTVRVSLSSPSFVFLVALADPKVAVVPENLNGKSAEEFFKNPDGIGPYRIEHFVSGVDRVELNVNSKYFLGKPKIDQIVFQKMSQADAQRVFEEGKVHDLELYTIPVSKQPQLARFANQYSVSASSASFIFFNGRKEFFHSAKTRKAIAEVLNVQSLTKQCDVPFAKSSGFIPPGIMGWADPKYMTARPVEHSEKIESKTFHALKKKPLIFVSYGNENDDCVLSGLIKQLNDANIAVIHERLTQDQIIKRLESGNYDLFFETLSVRGSEPYHLLTYFDPRSRHSLLGFKDGWIPRLIDQIKATSAHQIRASLYRQLDQYMSSEKTYFIPVFSDIRNYFFARSVRGPTVPAIISMNNGFEEIWLN